jgi:hypothetical protein
MEVQYSLLLKCALEIGLFRAATRAAKSENHTNVSGCESSAQRRMMARLCATHKTYKRMPGWKHAMRVWTI